MHTSVNTLIATIVCILNPMNVNTKQLGARHTVSVPRKPMKPRQVRVRDDVWDEAMRIAAEREEILSEEIRKFLERYIRDAKRGKGR